MLSRHSTEIQVACGVTRHMFDFNRLTDLVGQFAVVAESRGSGSIGDDVFRGQEQSTIVDKKPGAAYADEGTFTLHALEENRKDRFRNPGDGIRPHRGGSAGYRSRFPWRGRTRPFAEHTADVS